MNKKLEIKSFTDENNSLTFEFFPSFVDVRICIMSPGTFLSSAVTIPVNEFNALLERCLIIVKP